jgi:hypothetical protein
MITRARPRQYGLTLATTIGVLAAVVAACSDSPTVTRFEMQPSLAKGGNTNDCGALPLSISFRDAVGDALRSDGAGAYVDVVDGTAHLNGATGRLMLWTAQDANSAPRVVNVAATSFIGGTTDRIYTNGHESETPQDIGCGFKDMANGATGSAVLEVELDADGIVRYGKACDGSAFPANRVVTTRSADGLSWTVTGTTGKHCKKLGKKGGLSEVGSAGGFQMTLVTLP